MQEGVCLVISPLLALMQDQIDTLLKKNIKAVALNKPLSQDETIVLFDNIRFNHIKFLYCSPEKLQSKFIQDKIRQLNISLVAIDEAHCISEWGHDFRPSYLKLNILKELCPNATTIALTATATNSVLSDIATQLQFDSYELYKSSFARSNLAYQIFEVEDKFFKIKQIFDKMNAPAILYCQTRNETKKLSGLLNAEGYNSTYYHGGLSNAEKKKSYDDWYGETKQIMVATNAFGMGIDKGNIRVVIHVNIPNSIENYIQESGRGGRDQHKAFAVTLLNKNDINRHYQNQERQQIAISDLKTIYFQLNQFFQIAKGEFNVRDFDFSLNDFCNKYKKEPTHTYRALKVLERQGILILTEGFQKKTGVKFIASSKHVLQYCDKHPESEIFIKTILRNYGGVFENFVTINEYSLSKRLECSKLDVISNLKKIEHAGLVKYIPENTNTRIQFLVPREDDFTINRISKRLKEQEKNKSQKTEAIINFIQNNTTCRSKQLLAYFDEQQEIDCGICDVCLTQKKQTVKTKDVQNELLKLLQNKELSSRELTACSTYNERDVLFNLQQLVEDKKVKITSINKYRTN